MQLATKLAASALLLVSASACELGVNNLNQPDVARVFSTPGPIQQTIGTGLQTAHNAVTTNNVMPQLLSLGLEHYSSLNNFQMGPRIAIPRSPIANHTGAPSEHFNDFSALSRGSRLRANALNGLDALIEADPSPTDGVLGSVAEDNTTRAFAFFSIGVMQGWLAMVYDSAAIVVPGLASDDIPELSDAHAVMASAIEMLDSAVAILTAGPVEDVPAAWLGGATDHASPANFTRLVRSWRARLRAGVARTPAERDAVNWNLVLADATNGIQSNFMVNTGGSTGWNIGFIGSQMFQDGRAWSQISMMYYGMADTSRGPDGTPQYQSFLAQPLGSRPGLSFLVRTPDRRWPAGNTRAAQVANSPLGDDITDKPYIKADVQDELGEAWGISIYQFKRTEYIRSNIDGQSNGGLWPEMVKAEIDLLAAEAHLRLGNIPQAITIIDSYRTANNLPSLAGLTSRDAVIPGATYSGTTVTPAPGAANCVPRVPLPNGGTACGTLWEAMKYEKRMETAFTSYGRWWIDGRGWGDLVQNTAVEYPVPYGELNARQKPTYNLGGGGASSAGPGTYGF